MNGRPAFSGDVLITSALIMNRQKVVQGANDAGDQRGAGVKKKRCNMF